MFRYATEKYYQTQIAVLEARIAKLTAKLAELSEKSEKSVDNDE